MQEGEAGAGDDTNIIAIATAEIAIRIRPLQYTKAAAEVPAL
jgi:hypothetical protein